MTTRTQRQIDSFVATMDMELPLAVHLANAFMEKMHYTWSIDEYQVLCEKIIERCGFKK